MKIKSEDVDYIYIDTSELTFRVVMNDDKGEDLVVHSTNVELSNLAINDLCDDVKKHIDAGKPLQVVKDDAVTFETDASLDADVAKTMEEIEDEVLSPNRFCINGNCED